MEVRFAGSLEVFETRRSDEGSDSTLTQTELEQFVMNFVSTAVSDAIRKQQRTEGALWVAAGYLVAVRDASSTWRVGKEAQRVRILVSVKPTAVRHTVTNRTPRTINQTKFMKAARQFIDQALEAASRECDGSILAGKHEFKVEFGSSMFGSWFYLPTSAEVTYFDGDNQQVHLVPTSGNKKEIL